MSLTLNQWALLGSWNNSTYDIRDTVTDLLSNPLFNNPVTGPLLLSTLTGLIGGGTATVTALVDGTSGLSALTPTQIIDLGALQTGFLDPGVDSIVPLSTFQLLGDAGMSFVSDVTMTVQGTVSDLASLTTQDIGDLAAAGIDVLTAGGQVVGMTVQQVLDLKDAGMVLGPLDTGTIVDTAANVVGLTVSQLIDLVDAGFGNIDTSDDAVFLTVAQAKAFVAANMPFAPGDVVTILDTGGNIGSLTPSDISDFVSLGVDIFNVLGNQVSFNVVQIKALVATDIAFTVGDIVTILDTGAKLAALSVTEIAALAAKGVAEIDATDNALSLTVDKFYAFSNGLIALASGDLVTLADTGAKLAAFTAIEIANLKLKGVDLIDATDNVVNLTVAQGKAIVSSLLAFVSGDVIKIVDTGANIATLTALEITALKIAGVDMVDAIDDALSIAVLQAKAFATAGLAFAEGDLVKVADTGANIAALTTSEITALKAAGVDAVDATDNVLSMSVAKTQAFVAAGIALTEADLVKIADTGANIVALTTSEIAALKAAGVDAVDASDNALSMGVAQAKAFAAAGIAFVEADLVKIEDTGANIAAPTTGEIAALKAAGVDAVDATDDQLALSVSKAKAFATAGIAIAEADVVKIVDTGANIAALTTGEIAALKAAGADAVDATDDTLALTVSNAKAFAAESIAIAEADLVRIVDTGANIAVLTTSEIAALKAAGIDAVDATDDALSMSLAQARAFASAGITLAEADLVKVIDTGANIAAMTTGEIAAIKAAGVDAVDAIDDAISMGAAKAKAFAAAGLAFAEADVVKIVDTGANIAALTASEIAAIKAAGADAVDATNDAISMGVAQAKAFAASGLAFVEADVIKVVDTGANIATLTTNEIAALKAAGADAVDATDDALVISVAQAKAFATAGLALAEADLVTIADTGAAIAALTTSQITAIKASGADAVDATDDALTMLLSKAQAFVAAGIAFAAADLVKVADTADNIASLTADALAALKAAGVDAIEVTGGSVSVTVVQARNYIASSLAFADSMVVTLADTGANIVGVTQSEIADLKSLGVDIIDATDNTALMDLAKAKAFATAGLAFVAGDLVTIADTGTNIAALATGDIAGLKTSGFDIIDATDNAILLNVAHAKAFATAGLAFAQGDVVKVVDTGAMIHTLTKASIVGMRNTGVDIFDATDNVVSLGVQQYKALGSIQFAANDDLIVRGNSLGNTIVAHGTDVTLKGLGGVDRLTGGAKHDVLAGGLGNDILKGGRGADEFLFDTRLGHGNVDKIRDFNIRHDHIDLENAIFKAVGNSLSKGEFYIGSAAHDRSDHIIYDKVHGALLYDHDGKGHDAAVKFATIDPGLHLTAGDFIIL